MNLFLVILVALATLLIMFSKDKVAAVIAMIMVAGFGIIGLFLVPESLLGPLVAVGTAGWFWYLAAIPWEEKTFVKKVVLAICQLPLLALAFFSSFSWNDLLLILALFNLGVVAVMFIPNKIWEP